MNPRLLRPDLRRAYDHLVALMADGPEGDLLSIARSGLERYGDIEPPPPLTNVDVTPIDAGGVGSEWVMFHDADPTHRIVHFHGGGLFSGSVSSHRRMAAALSKHSGAAVLTVGYRLAPEHAYPAAQDDCAAAFDYACGHGPAGGHGAGSIAVSGDSAGGGLAVGLAVDRWRRGLRGPDSVVLICPCLDSAPAADRPARPDDMIVTPDSIAAMTLYAGELALDDPKLSPLRLPDEGLVGFPPTLIQASTAEYSLDDAQRFSARLAALERRAVLSLWPHMPHVWHAFLGWLPEADEALQEAGRFLIAMRR